MFFSIFVQLNTYRIIQILYNYLLTLPENMQGLAGLLWLLVIVLSLTNSAQDLPKQCLVSYSPFHASTQTKCTTTRPKLVQKQCLGPPRDTLFHCPADKDAHLANLELKKALRTRRVQTLPKPKPNVVPPDNKHFDFASESAGAQVLGHSAHMKGASRILEGNPDKYLMVPCSERSKWVVLQLSEDIKATAVAFSNQEHYSSGFRDVQVLGSDRYPTSRWILLANLTAQDTSELQTFPVQDQAWVRYLKLRFLSHHHPGQHFCTLTDFRVFGLRVLEDLQDDEVVALPDDDEEFVTKAPAVDVRRDSIFRRLTTRMSVLEEEQKTFVRRVDNSTQRIRKELLVWKEEIESVLLKHVERVKLDLKRAVHRIRKAAVEYDKNSLKVLGMREELHGLEEQMKTVEVLLITLVLLVLVLFVVVFVVLFYLSTRGVVPLPVPVAAVKSSVSQISRRELVSFSEMGSDDEVGLTRPTHRHSFSTKRTKRRKRWRKG